MGEEKEEMETTADLSWGQGPVLEDNVSNVTLQG